MGCATITGDIMHDWLNVWFYFAADILRHDTRFNVPFVAPVVLVFALPLRNACLHAEFMNCEQQNDEREEEPRDEKP